MSLRSTIALLYKKIDFRILAFGIVGAIGFVIDASALTFLTVNLKLNVLLARSVSFTCATLVTWLLNRKFTFSRQAARESLKRRKEYFLYIAVQMIGAIFNLMVFLTMIKWQPAMRLIPVVPLSIGAVIGLVSNFLMSRKFVFLEQGEKDE